MATEFRNIPFYRYFRVISAFTKLIVQLNVNYRFVQVYEVPLRGRFVKKPMEHRYVSCRPHNIRRR